MTVDNLAYVTARTSASDHQSFAPLMDPISFAECPTNAKFINTAARAPVRTPSAHDNREVRAESD